MFAKESGAINLARIIVIRDFLSAIATFEIFQASRDARTMVVRLTVVRGGRQ